MQKRETAAQLAVISQQPSCCSRQPAHLGKAGRQAGNVARQLSVRAAAVALQLRHTLDQQLLLKLGRLDLLH